MNNLFAVTSSEDGPDLASWQFLRHEARLDISYLETEAAIIFPEKYTLLRLNLLDVSSFGVGAWCAQAMKGGSIVHLQLYATDEAVWAKVAFCRPDGIGFRLGFSLVSPCDFYRLYESRLVGLAIYGF